MFWKGSGSKHGGSTHIGKRGLCFMKGMCYRDLQHGALYWDSDSVRL